MRRNIFKMCLPPRKFMSWNLHHHTDKEHLLFKNIERGYNFFPLIYLLIALQEPFCHWTDSWVRHGLLFNFLPPVIIWKVNMNRKLEHFSGQSIFITWQQFMFTEVKLFLFLLFITQRGILFFFCFFKKR